MVRALPTTTCPKGKVAGLTAKVEALAEWEIVAKTNTPNIAKKTGSDFEWGRVIATSV
jgi:hypothetical protein